MQINSSPISYQGLNRQISKEVITKTTADAFCKLYPKSNGIVGNIPHEWVKNIPPQDREKNIKYFYDKMGTFIYWGLPIFSDSTISSHILTKIFRKTGIIDKNNQIKITSFMEGALSDGYIISDKNSGKQFFLKRFKKTFDNYGLRKTGLHGASPEINVKAYFKKHLKTRNEKNLFSQFYYGDIKNNYYIEEFINGTNIYCNLFAPMKENAKRKITDTLAKHNLIHTDLHNFNLHYYVRDKDNLIMAKCFDLGGIDKSDGSRTLFYF